MLENEIAHDLERIGHMSQECFWLQKIVFLVESSDAKVRVRLNLVGLILAKFGNVIHRIEMTTFLNNLSSNKV